MNYETLKDEELAMLSSNGHSEAGDILLVRYKNYVKKVVRPYFIAGADREDLVQEGMIGLYKAVREYRPDKAAAFASFAAVCIKNQVLTAVKNASRKKHGPLNTYISINSEDFEAPYIIDNINNPEKILMNRELKNNIENLVIDSLSSLESSILTHYLDGLSYAQIGEKLGKSPKAVDNALFRIRRKAAKVLK